MQSIVRAEGRPSNAMAETLEERDSRRATACSFRMALRGSGLNALPMRQRGKATLYRQPLRGKEERCFRGSHT